MSAYGHQMEREFSAQSLSSGGGEVAGSEMGSRYAGEMGIYMSSFAATVLVAGLVTVGVSLLTLVIALVVMLQSCQTRNAGVVDMPRSIYDYEYCKIVAYHVELNGLGVDSFPITCKDVLGQYVGEGQYLKDLNTTIRIAENYLSSLRPMEDLHNVVVMDLDDLLPTDFSYPNLMHHFKHLACTNCVGDAKYLKPMFVQNLLQKLRANGWQLILLSVRSERLRNAIEKYLISAGCYGWSALIMRTDEEQDLSTDEYLSRQRIKLRRDGFHIVATITSKMDALRVPHSGMRIFKLPNFDFFDYIEHYFEARTI